MVPIVERTSPIHLRDIIQKTMITIDNVAHPIELEPKRLPTRADLDQAMRTIPLALHPINVN